MRRQALDDLTTWVNSESRKPIVVRGARQVGKTWLVRELAKETNKKLIEFNFEKTPDLLSLFSSNDPKSIIRNIEVHIDSEIDVNECILFLDEIQAQPELLAKLRWFAEDLRELAVIAAGSLLEFVLEDHEFSMPVGRIQYYHLEPLSFVEYLVGLGKKPSADYLASYQLGDDMPDVIHQKLSSAFSQYVLVGGMPEACVRWKEDRSMLKVSQVHQDLLATYRDDFSKYSRRMSVQRLDEALISVPKQLGQKFVYRQANPDVQAVSVKNALGLLSKARICHRVQGVSANGVPLMAEPNDRCFKIILLDVGLAVSALGLYFSKQVTIPEIELVNKGAIAEQVVGQLLRTIEPYFVTPALCYWQREKKGSEAEIDYVIQHNDKVVPIEVKPGQQGSLKSLHLMMAEKKHSVAIRFSANRPELKDVSQKTQNGKTANYRLLSLPLYMVEQSHRLLHQIL